MCILQIGELVERLSEDFRTQHHDIPWNKIKAMRNIVAHRYGTVDAETTWKVITEDVPELKRYCESLRNCHGIRCTFLTQDQSSKSRTKTAGILTYFKV